MFVSHLLHTIHHSIFELCFQRSEFQSYENMMRGTVKIAMGNHHNKTLSNRERERKFCVWD